MVCVGIPIFKANADVPPLKFIIFAREIEISFGKTCGTLAVDAIAQAWASMLSVYKAKTFVLLNIKQ